MYHNFDYFNQIKVHMLKINCKYSKRPEKSFDWQGKLTSNEHESEREGESWGIPQREKERE